MLKLASRPVASSEDPRDCWNQSSDGEAPMIVAFARFQYGSDFDEARVRKIADEARQTFEGMPGLRSQVLRARPRSKEAIASPAVLARKSFSTRLRVESTKGTPTRGLPCASRRQLGQVLDRFPRNAPPKLKEGAEEACRAREWKKYEGRLNHAQKLEPAGEKHTAGSGTEGTNRGGEPGGCGVAARRSRPRTMSG